MFATKIRELISRSQGLACELMVPTVWCGPKAVWEFLLDRPRWWLIMRRDRRSEQSRQVCPLDGSGQIRGEMI